MGSYHTSGRFEHFDGITAKKLQQEIDAACGNDAIKYRQKIVADWELPPAGKQQNEEVARGDEQQNCFERHAGYETHVIGWDLGDPAGDVCVEWPICQ